MEQFFDLVWADLGSIYTVHKKKTSITGTFGNDLQADHCLTQSDYGRIQNQAFVALRDYGMWYYYVYLFLTFINHFATLHQSLKHAI